MTEADHTQFVLASASPRRAELLGRLGYRFRVEPSDIDESLRTKEAPADFVQRLAREKAAANGATKLPVMGADTIVVAPDGTILGKPRDRADALAMLAMLSGREHQVMTAVNVRHGRRSETIMTSTTVEFASVSRAQAEAYWASGEARGKAGAYGIQGLAETFVTQIRGSYSGVVGLPLQQSISLLQLFAIQPPVFGTADRLPRP